MEHLLDAKVLKLDGSLLSLAGFDIQLTADQERLRRDILEMVRKGKTAPPDLQELSAKAGGSPEAVRAVVAAMQAMGDLVRLEGALLFDPRVLAGIEQRLVEHLNTHGEMEVAAFRDMVGTTRKYAVPLLNYFDNRGVTVRRGDVRVLRG